MQLRLNRIAGVMITAVLVLAFGNAALAADAPTRGAVPDWVRTIVPTAATAAVDTGAPYRARLLDQQIRIDDQGTHAFSRSRVRIDSPLGLTGAGTIVIPWNPANQTVTLHYVQIQRGTQTLDVLATQTFEVLRREENLELAILDGVLTASLQVNDLRIGDELDVAYTLTTRQTAFGNHAEALGSVMFPVAVDQVHLRASWPDDRPMRFRVSDGLTAAPVKREGDQRVIQIDALDLQPLAIPEDAPVRFHKARQFELTDFADWKALSVATAPLYTRAATLTPDSPLLARIEAIKIAHATPTARAEAALRLVQEEVRYLALVMGEGDYVPATADQTWQRRLGDCKAKTALLLALLRELGIEAQPALVSVQQGDGLDQDLPLVGRFDHILVRATIEGRVYWLDGARTGDRSLADVPVPSYGWALPVDAEGADLVQLVVPPLEQAQSESQVTLDASAGLYSPMPTTGELVMRGDIATTFSAQIGAMGGQADAFQRTYWQALLPGLDVTTVASTYDADRNRLAMTMTGTLRASWDSGSARRYELPTTRVRGFVAERDPGPYADLPFYTLHPVFNRQRTTLILPSGSTGFRIDGTDFEENLGGYSFARRARIADGRVTAEVDIRSLAGEVSATDAKAAVAPLTAMGTRRLEIVAPSAYRATDADRAALVALTPTTAKEYIEQGATLNANGQVDEALAAFEKAIELEPDNALAYANRGIVRYWDSDRDAARTDFDKASDLDPAERVAMNGRALLALDAGEYQDAVIELTRSLRQEPNDLFALDRRATAYEGLGDYVKALADVRRALEAHPDNLDLKVREIALLSLTEQDADAISRLDAVIAAETPSASPQYVFLQRGLARLKLDTGDVTGARAAIEQAHALSPEDSETLLLRAEIAYRQDDVPAALSDVAIVRLAAGDSATKLNNLCWAQARARINLEAALADCDRALELQPGSTPIRDSRAMVLLNLGRHAEADALYDTVLAEQPRYPTSLFGRGLARRALGQEAEAEADIAAARAIQPAVDKTFAAYLKSTQDLPR